jgi:GNAT superfamily N-acetyltransferase
MDARLNSLFYKAEHYFFEAISSRFCSFGSHSAAYGTEIQDPGLNILFIREAVPSLEQIIVEGSAFFKTAEISWYVEIPLHLCSEAWLKELAKYGFHPTEVTVAMALPLKMSSDLHQEISEIKPMNNRLDEWAMPLIAFPSTTIAVNKEYKNRHERALMRNKALFHFSLFENSEVISSLTLSLNEGLARIDDVATKPGFQGKGYATKLIKYALHTAAKKGASFCFLEASQKGLSIYQNMNFRCLFENQTFCLK